jgi:hypothetical protein
MARGEHAVILLVENNVEDALKVRRALEAAGVRNPFFSFGAAKKLVNISMEQGGTPSARNFLCRIWYCSI